ncbi:MAG: hypothetical protein FWF71_06565 [Actinomycetia bacterium]|nr:hypothetical protein [Actinomycetes bacterium]
MQVLVRIFTFLTASVLAPLAMLVAIPWFSVWLEQYAYYRAQIPYQVCLLLSVCMVLLILLAMGFYGSLMRSNATHKVFNMVCCFIGVVVAAACTILVFTLLYSKILAGTNIYLAVAIAFYLLLLLRLLFVGILAIMHSRRKQGRLGKHS